MGRLTAEEGAIGELAQDFLDAMQQQGAADDGVATGEAGLVEDEDVYAEEFEEEGQEGADDDGDSFDEP